MHFRQFQKLGLAVFLVLMAGLFGMVSPYFLTRENITNILVQSQVLALCDLVFLNPETLSWIAQSSDVEKAATSLRGLGAKTVIVTLGEKGSLAVGQREETRMAPFKVDVEDATGAGDCFAAAFCHGYLQGWPLRETMMFASAASALFVTRTGARTGRPMFQEVSSFLENSAKGDPRPGLHILRRINLQSAQQRRVKR